MIRSFLADFVYFLFFVLLILSMVREVHAFPEMTRHGYTHCTACHTSIVGGNLLNPYGRSLSRELLSQKTLAGRAPEEGSEEFLSGQVKPPDWLLAGGDVRILQSFTESKEASRARFLIMQVDLDSWEKITDRVSTFFSIGRVEPHTEDASAKDYVSSPRNGVEVLLTPPENANRATLRMGRFMPAYGIAFAEHTLATRKFLDFQPGQERNASELAWTNDTYSVVGTGIFSQAIGNQVKSETGGILQVASSFREKSKIGINYYQSDRQELGASYTRRIAGAFMHLGFDENWYGLLEVDQPQGADGKWGLVETFKLGHEVFQGFHWIGIQEYANLDLDRADPKFEAYSTGVEWFPKSHWDLYGLFRQERNSAETEDFQSVVWLIAHYYL